MTFNTRVYWEYESQGFIVALLRVAFESQHNALVCDCGNIWVCLYVFVSDI